MTLHIPLIDSAKEEFITELKQFLAAILPACIWFASLSSDFLFDEIHT
jgi:hypothetical protein